MDTGSLVPIAPSGAVVVAVVIVVAVKSEGADKRSLRTALRVPDSDAVAAASQAANGNVDSDGV